MVADKRAGEGSATSSVGLIEKTMDYHNNFFMEMFSSVNVVGRLLPCQPCLLEELHRWLRRPSQDHDDNSFGEDDVDGVNFSSKENTSEDRRSLKTTKEKREHQRSRKEQEKMSRNRVLLRCSNQFLETDHPL
ncbi:unnamed protein product [Victoria cruziana]